MMKVITGMITIAVFALLLSGCINKNEIVQKLEILSPKNGDANVGTSSTVLLWSCSASETMLFDVLLTSNGADKYISKNQSDTSIIMSSLTASTTYTVKIIAKRTTGEVSKTVEGTFITANTGSTAVSKMVTAVLPADQSSNIEINTVITWDCTSLRDTIMYDVYFGKDSSNMSVLVSNATDKSCELTNLNYNTKYYWQIVTKNNKAIAIDTSNIFAFTTRPVDVVLDVPVQAAPFTGDTGVGTSTDLKWNYSGILNGVTFQIFTGTADATLTLNGEVSNKYFYTITGLAGNTKYFWKVVAKDAKGNTKESNVWYFTTK